MLGGAAMGSTVERVLGPCRSWPRRGALYLLLGFTLGLPAWVGDHNPILLFLPFLTVFLLCGGGRPQARLVAGGIFYTLLVPIGMMADTVLKQAINSVSHNGERMGSNLVKLVCWAVLVPVIWKLVRRPVRLSSRLWKLLGGLTLAPLMATLSFSLWGTGMVGDELVDHFVEGIAYTILPFASLSALPCWAPWPSLPGHEELEEENRLAGLREVYYQGPPAGAGPGARPAAMTCATTCPPCWVCWSGAAGRRRSGICGSWAVPQPSPDTGASAVMRPWMWSLPPRPPPWRRRG